MPPAFDFFNSAVGRSEHWRCGSQLIRAAQQIAIQGVAPIDFDDLYRGGRACGGRRSALSEMPSGNGAWQITAKSFRVERQYETAG